MKKFIDLNCDLGEYDCLSQGANDAAIMPHISSCNVACGMHAGNPEVVAQTIALAAQNGVHVGAHPSYPDREHFGRRKMKLPIADLTATVIDQLQLVASVCEAQGQRLFHVKPHGALYNQAAQDVDLSIALIEAVTNFNPDLLFYGLAHSATADAAAQVGVAFVAEGFADRAYTDRRFLQPRSEPNAMINHPDEVLQRAIHMLEQQQTQTVNGTVIELTIDSLCLHGDSAHAVLAAKTLSQGLIKAGYQLRAPESM